MAGQIPQVNDLYAALVAGLEGQAQAGTQNILADAEIRGVGRARLGEDVGGVLGEALALEQARAGAQQAGDIAGITGNLTDLRTGKITGRQDLANSLQDIGLARAGNQLTLQEQRRQYNMDILGLERQAELDKQAASIARARQAASASGAASGATVANGPTATQREDGGFAFTDAKGGQISAATYAQKTGQSLASVLGQMAGQGDVYAEAVLRQFAADPFYNKNQKRYKELYPAIFNDKFKF